MAWRVWNTKRNRVVYPGPNQWALLGNNDPAAERRLFPTADVRHYILIGQKPANGHREGKKKPAEAGLHCF